MQGCGSVTTFSRSFSTLAYSIERSCYTLRARCRRVYAPERRASRCVLYSLVSALPTAAIALALALSHDGRSSSTSGFSRLDALETAFGRRDRDDRRRQDRPRRRARPRAVLLVNTK